MSTQTMSDQGTIEPLSAELTRAVEAVYLKLDRKASSQQEMAACYGVRSGLLTAEELPDPADFAGDEDGFRVAVDRLLRAREVMAGYIDEQRAGVVVADCPWWCDGKHELLSQGLWGQPEHSTAVCQVTFDDDTRQPAVVKVIEGDEPTGELALWVSGLDLDSGPLSTDEARSVAEALVLAAARLDQIEAASSRVSSLDT